MDGEDLKKLKNAIVLTKRLGNYLFLPVLILSLLIGAFMLLPIIGGDPIVNDPGEKKFIIITYGSMIISFIFWRLSRKPRPFVFITMGIILGIFTAGFTAWIIYRIFTERNIRITIEGLTKYGIITGMAYATWECLKMWLFIKKISPIELDDLLRELE